MNKYILLTSIFVCALIGALPHVSPISAEAPYNGSELQVESVDQNQSADPDESLYQQESVDQSGQTEAILSFDSQIHVNADNSIDVTEIIVHDSGPNTIRGIFRDMYPYSSQKRKMVIDRIEVKDEYGEAYPFSLMRAGKNMRIQIGDPEVTYQGVKTYIITYRATHAVGQFKDVDEIYWNVTGNEWLVPVYQATASITLPSGVSMTQSACYLGIKKSTETCPTADVQDESYTFYSPRALEHYEGITVAVGFSKGTVTPYTFRDNLSNFFIRYWPWLLALGLPLLIGILSLVHWYKKGRDERATSTIVAQYEVIDDLTPIEVEGIINEEVNIKGISAEIIYLATKGYIQIKEIKDTYLGVMKKTDYELVQVKDVSDIQNTFDQTLVRQLFSGSSGETPSVKLSDLQHVFYRYVDDVVLEVLQALVQKGYYKRLGRMTFSGNRLQIFVFVAVFIGGFSGVFIGAAWLQMNPFPFIIAIAGSIMTYGVISHFNPAKTAKGVTAKEHVLGLKQYLQIAEKDRLIFHNAPDKNPEVFETLLPYAIILGVADIWAREFEGIYHTPPSWYSGSVGSTFSASTFSEQMSSFSSFASSSLASAPTQHSGGSSGSGSSGGGSSGGGGGGGGGGSW